MANYRASFVLNGKKQILSNLELSNHLNLAESFIESRLKRNNSIPLETQINIADQVLEQFPDATDIYVYEMAETKNEGNAIGALLALLVIALIIALLIAPVILALFMFNVIKKKNLFEKVMNIPQYQKFRKLYIICGGVIYVAIIALFIVSIIVWKNLITVFLFALVGFDLVYFIMGFVFGNIIYKKHKDDVIEDKTEAVSETKQDEVNTFGEKQIEEKAIIEEPKENIVNESTGVELVKEEPVHQNTYIHKMIIIFLIICSALTLLGLFVDIVVAAINKGSVKVIYEEATKGYMAGFALSSVAFIATVVLMIVLSKLQKKEERTNSASVAFVLGFTSIILSIFLLAICAIA